MSTNDMVTVLANGLAKNKTISKPGKDFNTFSKALAYICLDLAKKIVLDGEGATKFITIDCLGAQNVKQALKVALTVANSNLVKTAAYGSNPNWGRVAAAVGSLGIKGVSESNLRIKFSSFEKKEIHITADLNIGSAKATTYTSDLSLQYVRINGRYN
jgi:glutamate N-acetyltransferase/amino-acid N-acetyltransferase